MLSTVILSYTPEMLQRNYYLIMFALSCDYISDAFKEAIYLLTEVSLLTK